jgi:hypothetical protein
MTTKEALLRRLRDHIGTHADFIKRNPDKFKACEGCDRVVPADAHECPLCHAYRFDSDPARVLERASFRQEAVEKYYPTLPRF